MKQIIAEFIIYICSGLKIDFNEQYFLKIIR